MKRRGFSLIEILVALAILGMGIVVLFNIFPSAWQSFAYSRILNRIGLLAQQKLEEVRSVSQVTPGTSTGTDKDLSWTLLIEPVQLEPNVSLMRVQLDVEFLFQKASQRERFVTYRAG